MRHTPAASSLVLTSNGKPTICECASVCADQDPSVGKREVWLAAQSPPPLRLPQSREDQTRGPQTTAQPIGIAQAEASRLQPFPGTMENILFWMEENHNVKNAETRGPGAPCPGTIPDSSFWLTWGSREQAVSWVPADDPILPCSPRPEWEAARSPRFVWK